MATLNLMCAICNEFYKGADSVYSTRKCGHLFHKQCLFRWLETSATCPQCRHPSHRHNVHRVYLNFSAPTEQDYELDTINLDVAEWCILDLTPGNSSKEPPVDALQSGTDEEGNKVYVARCYYKNDMLPANYVPEKKHIRVPWNCVSNTIENSEDVEYLVDDGRYTWVRYSNGRVPENAVDVGYTNIGERLYTGRALFRGITMPGKVHPSHRVLYMPWRDKEENVRQYEVLVRLPKPSENATSTSIESTEAGNIQQPIVAEALPEAHHQQHVEQERQDDEEEYADDEEQDEEYVSSSSSS